MGDTAALLAILTEELSRHPHAEPYDLQKLIYQTVFGGDHLLRDWRRFAASLCEEWTRLRLNEGKDERAPLQVIDPEGRTARLHLLPCKTRGVAVEDLVRLLISQPLRRGERSRYERIWNEVIGLAEAGSIPFTVDVLARLSLSAELPHHGQGYGAACYRIVNDLTAPGMLAGLRRLGLLL